MYRGYFFFFLLFTVTLSAQAPQKINFQAVLRSPDGTLLTNQSIAFRVYILSASPTGAVVYTEAHQKTTDAAGLVSLQIGGGTALFGIFQTINWSTGTYFAKLEADLSGGSNFSTLVIQELMSVPYALYASKADTALKSKPEVDPLFTQSTASGITSTDTAKWNQLAAYLDQLTLRIDSLQTRISVLEQSDTNQNTLPEYVPTDSLIGWWPFNGNAKDASGNGNDGTVVGAVLAGDRFGTSNSSYGFDIGQQITLSNTPNLNPYPLTISVWYKVREWDTGENSSIVFKYSSGAWNGFGISLNNFNYIPSSASFYLRSPQDRILGLYGEPRFDLDTIRLSEWYHYVFVVDSSGGKIFVNGALIAQHSWTGSPGATSSNQSIIIGGRADTWFRGYIDDIGIWNRALTPQEISNLYHATY